MQKLEGYWNWSKEDDRLQIFNPWHWTSQCVNKSHGSYADVKRGLCVHENGTANIQYNRGAVEFPLLLAKMAEIGRAINHHNQLSAPVLKTDESEAAVDRCPGRAEFFVDSRASPGALEAGSRDAPFR